MEPQPRPRRATARPALQPPNRGSRGPRGPPVRCSLAAGFAAAGAWDGRAPGHRGPPHRLPLAAREAARNVCGRVRPDALPRSPASGPACGSNPGPRNGQSRAPSPPGAPAPRLLRGAGGLWAFPGRTRAASRLPIRDQSRVWRTDSAREAPARARRTSAERGAAGRARGQGRLRSASSGAGRVCGWRTGGLQQGAAETDARLRPEAQDHRGGAPLRPEGP